MRVYLLLQVPSDIFRHGSLDIDQHACISGGDLVDEYGGPVGQDDLGVVRALLGAVLQEQTDEVRLGHGGFFYEVLPEPGETAVSDDRQWGTESLQRQNVQILCNFFYGKLTLNKNVCNVLPELPET